MKVIFEEYGKIIFLCLIALTLLTFALSQKTVVTDPSTGVSTEEKGLLGYLGDIKPVPYFGTDNNMEILQGYSERENPTLEVETQKLLMGNSYNLLSFVTKSEACDGTALTAEVVEVVNPNGLSLDIETMKVGSEVLLDLTSGGGLGEYVKGLYKVTYEVVDNHFSSYPLITSKTYLFVVD